MSNNEEHTVVVVSSYTCDAAMAATIEAAFAANGYHINIQFATADVSQRIVMIRNHISVLLTYNPGSDSLAITIWDDSEATATRLLGSLPIRLRACQHRVGT